MSHGPVNIAATGWYAPVLMLTPDAERDTASMASILKDVARNAELRVGVKDTYLVTETAMQEAATPDRPLTRLTVTGSVILGPNPRRSDQYSYIRRYGSRSFSAIMRVVPDT